MIYIATMAYALGKELGFEEAVKEFHRQIADPDTDSLPAARMVARARVYDELALDLDVAATSIGKARSRAFHRGLAAKADVMLWVDDDVECDAMTLGHLIDAVRGSETVCVAPCITRGGNIVNCAFEPDAQTRTLPGGAVTRQIVCGGFGLVAMSGEAMQRMRRDNTIPAFVDEDGDSKLAPFLEEIAGRQWLGEDVAFCRRALRAGVRLEALATGLTSHAGQPLQLDQVASLETWTPPYAD